VPTRKKIIKPTMPLHVAERRVPKFKPLLDTLVPAPRLLASTMTPAERSLAAKLGRAAKLATEKPGEFNQRYVAGLVALRSLVDDVRFEYHLLQTVRYEHERAAKQSVKQMKIKTVRKK
jgi:hypothetical protein